MQNPDGSHVHASNGFNSSNLPGAHGFQADEHPLAALGNNLHEDVEYSTKIDALRQNGLHHRSFDTLLATARPVNYGTPLFIVLYRGTSGFTTPLPLGRFGQLFLPGWLWGSVDPRDLFRPNRDGVRIEPQSPEFQHLAYEAATLPFPGRSETQRIIVAWATQLKILPTIGWKREPDVLFECSRNPERVPFAVRRSYVANHNLGIHYTQWDVIDLDCWMLLRMSQPTRTRYQPYLLRAPWIVIVQDALTWAPAFDDRFNLEPYPCGPQPYAGDGVPIDVLLHLYRCGIAAERLLPGGDFVDFIQRMGAYHEEYERWNMWYKEAMLQAGLFRTQANKRAFVDAQLRIMPVPLGHPVVRIKSRWTSGDDLVVGDDDIVRGIFPM